MDTRRDTLRDKLYRLAEREIPADVDLWPAIRARAVPARAGGGRRRVGAVLRVGADQVAAVALLVVFIGALVLVSQGAAGRDRAAAPGAPASPAATAPAAGGTPAGVGTPPPCPVTVPDGNPPPGQPPAPGYHGNGALWTQLPSEVKIPFTAEQTPPGVLAVNWSWWRGVRGDLSIQGRRLDAPAPPLQALIRGGYGDSGYQLTALSFPTPGCWEVTGMVGDASLTFVVLVVAEVPPVRQTPPPPPGLRQCGSEGRVNYRGEGRDTAARECLWQAYAAGEPARFTTTRTTVEGHPITFDVRVLAPGRIEVIIDAADRGKIFRHTCTIMERHVDPYPPPAAPPNSAGFQLGGCDDAGQGFVIGDGRLYIR
ncbi:MAG: hypothetical protein M3Q65_26400 [Chloroflexota bacterium]|nr:hypothetical protein [Chloroflexota bacterium]